MGLPRTPIATIVEESRLGKPSQATRRLTSQRQRELYALDPGVPLFRILRRLWKHATLRDPTEVDARIVRQKAAPMAAVAHGPVPVLVS